MRMWLFNNRLSVKGRRNDDHDDDVGDVEGNLYHVQMLSWWSGFMDQINMNLHVTWTRKTRWKFVKRRGKSLIRFTLEYNCGNWKNVTGKRQARVKK